MKALRSWQHLTLKAYVKFDDTNKKVFNVQGKEQARQKVCTENNSLWLEHMIN